MTTKLLIANKNYSTWSLRPWIVLKHFEIPFEEEYVSFNAPDFGERVRRYSPVGRVPVLVDNGVIVWDSLAILEYVAERFPEKQLWPTNPSARAHARAICAEMHAGFQALRSALPMNCSAKFTNVLLPNAVNRDINRILSIWQNCRERFGQTGRFLFGNFSIADGYFAPVVRRFSTYGISLPDFAREYSNVIDQLPAMKEWVQAAQQENDFVPEDEPYRTKF